MRIPGIREGDTMTTQETRGTIKKLTGQVKEAAGIVTGDKKLEREGKVQHAAGDIKEKAKEIADDVKKTTENLVDKVKSAFKA